jgi:hypothetical protein
MQHLTTTRRIMGKKDDPDQLPRRDRTKAAEKMAERRKADDRPGGFSAGGGPRTRADGVQMGEGHPDGWQTGGRDGNG